MKDVKEAMIYLDHSATTRLSDTAKKAMEPYLQDYFGNPAGGYSFAEVSREAVEQARKQMAYLMRARPEEIYFTSGGTESDNWALRQAAELMREKGNHIITTSIEHHAVLHTCHELERQGFRVTYLPVDKFGCISTENLLSAICDDTILVSVMYANNEVGTVQPIQAIGRITSEMGILFHVDAVQAFGQIPIYPEQLGIDLMSISAHKFNGPKGVGVLYVNHNVPLTAFLHGGSQESGMRAGTSNVPGIIGMTAAAVEWSKNRRRWTAWEQKLRNYFVMRVLREIPDVTLTGHPKQRLYGNAHFVFRDINGLDFVKYLDKHGIMAATGSACSTGQKKASHVLVAMGYPDDGSYGALRFTVGYENTKEEIDRTVQVLKEGAAYLRNIAQK